MRGARSQHHGARQAEPGDLASASAGEAQDGGLGAHVETGAADAISTATAAQVAVMISAADDGGAAVVARARALRGERFVFDVYKALLLETGHLGGFSWTHAVASLMAQHRAGSEAIMAELFDAAPEHRGPILAALDDLGLLDNLLAPLPFAEVEQLHDRVLAGPRTGASTVLSKMRRYFENKDRSDHSLSHYLGKVPVVGGGLNTIANAATFGFVGQHDAAYREMRAGHITSDDYDHATIHAAARAAVLGGVSLATGGAAGAYAEGASGGLAALGTGGRIASATLAGAAGGAGAGFGGQVAEDVLDHKLSSAGTYARSVGLGAATGAALGGGGAALVESLPVGARAWLATKLSRFPDVFDGWRELGERHALVLSASRLRELIADGAGRWASPQAVAAAGALPPDVPVRITGELTERGINVLHAERLPDGTPTAAGAGGRPEAGDVGRAVGQPTGDAVDVGVSSKNPSAMTGSATLPEVSANVKDPGVPAPERTSLPSDDAPRGPEGNGRLIVPPGRTLSPAEQEIADLLVNEGRTVEAVTESAKKTADFLVDGVPTELKTISNISSKDPSGALARRILEGGSQGNHVIVDVRAQAGMTRDDALRAVRRAYGADKAGRIQQVRVIGAGFDETVPRAKGNP
ncbi:MAG TPA: hypothetical protein VHE35_16490 [Kofleriaceae bacterium]|nr:hypothetical protein [Kofleriaceae bacterium]